MKNITASPLFKELALIFSIGFMLTAVVLLFGLDEKIAVAVYDTSATWAWEMRQYSPLPAIVLTLGFIIFLLFPFLRKKFPTVRRFALIWLFTVIFGAGIAVHLVGKEVTDRPRPRETVLLGGEHEFAHAFTTSSAQLEGKSFPSGHGTIGALFALPFFVLRRRYKKTALAFIGLGVIATGVIGYGRMVLGAHFLTDVLWSFIFMFATAAIGAALIKEKTDLKTRILLPTLLVLGLGVAMANKFTITLSLGSEEVKEWDISALNCPTVHYIQKPAEKSVLQVRIEAYGAPKSYLTLREENDKVELNKTGLYHSVKCLEATIVEKSAKNG